ncbi:MAG: arsenite efflux transporter metallochaperone ArsD [Balneolia bacterium]|nr:arsenite efflux transporter metallochaperone ArsD [Balneolia bacterium]
MKATLEIYDPAMCCSTGVCGTDLDDTLADFANDLKWLKSQGIEIKRFNLGQEPEAFKSNPHVLSRLQKEGSAILPVILVNSEVASEGGYPVRSQLCEWLGIGADSGQTAGSGEAQAALLQNLRESVMSGNSAAMEAFFKSGKEAGAGVQDMVEAMQAGLNERQNITQQVVTKANELLGVQQNGCTPGGGCC